MAITDAFPAESRITTGGYGRKSTVFWPFQPESGMGVAGRQKRLLIVVFAIAEPGRAYECNVFCRQVVALGYFSLASFAAVRSRS